MNKTIVRIKVGGLKVQEGGACVASSFPPGEDLLGSAITGPLAGKKINLTFLTHAAGSPERYSATVFCTEPADGSGSYTLVKARSGEHRPVQFSASTALVSLYPHEKRSEIKGNFLLSLAQAGVRILGVASSPAAITAVISLKAKDLALKALFQHFAFSAYQTPAEFHAVQHPPEKAVREVVASYQEKAPKIYCLVQEPELDLWEVSLPDVKAVAQFAAMLMALGEVGLMVPFLAGLPRLRKKELLFILALAGSGAGPAQTIIQEHLPGFRVARRPGVAALFTHGPHFGDRYGIAHTMVHALEQARVSLLALSCTVNSISVLIPRPELDNAVKAAGETFEAPLACPA